MYRGNNTLRDKYDVCGGIFEYTEAMTLYGFNVMSVEGLSE